MKKQKILVKDRGITLVALVVTIIILLILAGVTINMALGNNGLIVKTKMAKEEMGKAQTIENIQLSVLGSYDEDGRLEINTLKTNLIREVSNLDRIEGEEFPITVITKNGINYVVDESASIFEAKDRTGIEIGDYVDYSPDIPSTTLYPNTILNTYSGYTNNVSIKQDNLKWKVLRKYKDGGIDLIGSKTSQAVYMGGALGYNNGVYLLNDICRTLYSRNSDGIEARSINLSDFEYWLGQTEGGMEARNNYEYNGIKYNDEKEYTTNNSYPTIYKTQKNESDSGTLTTDMLDSSEEDLTVKQTYYIVASNKYGLLKEKIEFNDWIWVATRCVSCGNNSPVFSIYHCSTSLLDAGKFYGVDGYTNTNDKVLRPVVHLKARTSIIIKDGTSAIPHHIDSY